MSNSSDATGPTMSSQRPRNNGNNRDNNDDESNIESNNHIPRRLPLCCYHIRGRCRKEDAECIFRHESDDGVSMCSLGVKCTNLDHKRRAENAARSARCPCEHQFGYCQWQNARGFCRYQNFPINTCVYLLQQNKICRDGNNCLRTHLTEEQIRSLFEGSNHTMRPAPSQPISVQNPSQETQAAATSASITDETPQPELPRNRRISVERNICLPQGGAPLEDLVEDSGACRTSGSARTPLQDEESNQASLQEALGCLGEKSLTLDQVVCQREQLERKFEELTAQRHAVLTRLQETERQRDDLLRDHKELKKTHVRTLRRLCSLSLARLEQRIATLQRYRTEVDSIRRIKLLSQRVKLDPSEQRLLANAGWLQKELEAALEEREERRQLLSNINVPSSSNQSELNGHTGTSVN